MAHERRAAAGALRYDVFETHLDMSMRSGRSLGLCGNATRKLELISYSWTSLDLSLFKDCKTNRRLKVPMTLNRTGRGGNRAVGANFVENSVQLLGCGQAGIISLSSVPRQLPTNGAKAVVSLETPVFSSNASKNERQ